MTPEQEAHLKRIKTNFSSKVDKKYREGQKEHGGNLYHENIIQLLDKAINEAVDQVVYLETLREVIIGQ
jgi:acetyl-CoA carboxylase carboxyltransferase component